MSRFTYVCSRCGSDDVELEGCIRWDAAEQRFDVTTLCDKGHHCNACEDECSVERRELEQVSPDWPVEVHPAGHGQWSFVAGPISGVGYKSKDEALAAGEASRSKVLAQRHASQEIQ